MTNPELEATEDKRRRLSRIAGTEGYLSLLLMIVLLTFCPPLSSLISGTYGLLLVFTISVFAVLFAVSGVRHGTGMGRISAVLSLVILVISVVYVLRPIEQ